MSALADHFAATARMRPPPRREDPRPRAAPEVTGPAARPGVARLIAFVPLAALGALTWGTLVAPGASGGAWAMLAAATAAGGVLLAARRGGRPRAVLTGAVTVALIAAALLSAGVPLRLLAPAHWGTLADGLRQGVTSMPGITVPYEGLDEWVRVSILLCGWALAALGALLAFWPRAARTPGRPLPAALALGALYAIPVIERNPGHPVVGGVLFCVLLGAFLWFERLRSDQVGVGAASLAVIALAGAAAAPALDGSKPWIDFQHLADDIAAGQTATFSWNHTYGALDWPRDGREVLRVKAQVAAYWKAVNLDRFDGYGWRQDRAGDAARPTDTEIAPGHLEWHQTIRVIVRSLRSTDFVGAGSIERISDAPPAVRSSPYTFQTAGAPLQRGASYLARVYVPRPTLDDLGTDGTEYQAFTQAFLRMDLPSAAPGAAPVTVQFPAFHSAAPPEVILANGYSYSGGGGIGLVRRSPYARMYALARRLALQSHSPYDFVNRVRRRVEQGAVYDEHPGSHRWPLDAFLFSDRRGYCQQFSGAMALLLRMGGVPARVASGFAPGTFDRASGEYVVRDVDAHSWVEVYFPTYGWIPFDPTPAIAPARSQASGNSPSAARGDVRDLGGIGERGHAARAAQSGGTTPWGAIAAAALLALGLAVGIVALVRRGRLPVPPVAPELAELQVALHRTGRTPPPEVTLVRLERILGGSDGAAGYVRAVREQRFRGGPAPTREQRRALRRQLGAGLGLVGILRAWWGLPPKLRMPTMARFASRLDRRVVSS